MKRWKIIAGITLIFVSGMVAGGILTGFYAKYRIKKFVHGGPPAIKKVITTRLTRVLSLSNPQKNRIEQIIGETQAELQIIRIQHEPEIQAILDKAVSRMKTELNPDQQVKLEGIYKEMKDSWQLRRAINGPGTGSKSYDMGPGNNHGQGSGEKPNRVVRSASKP